MAFFDNNMPGNDLLEIPEEDRQGSFRYSGVNRSPPRGSYAALEDYVDNTYQEAEEKPVLIQEMDSPSKQYEFMDNTF